MNPSLLQSIAGIAAIAAAGGGALYVFFLMLRRAALDKRPLQIVELLRTQGDEAARLATASGSREFAFAVYRCVNCDTTARCREWLDGGGCEGYQRFCPNAGYVERVGGLAGK